MGCCAEAEAKMTKTQVAHMKAASATDERSRCSPLRFARPTINQAATFAMRCYKNNFKRLHNYYKQSRREQKKHILKKRRILFMI